MCGIVGIAGSHEDKESILRDSCRKIAYRGPDSQGVWLSPEGHIGFGHVRLAIQDLSEQGHQPMPSADQRFMMVFNGEIYNHPELRAQLEQNGQAPAWRGHSDTETLLACFCAWGIEHTLKTAIGMFAIAVWDRQEKKLILARDRFGEKPLYYGFTGQGLVFASELKAMMDVPGFEKKLNRDAVTLLLRHNYIPAPYSIFKNTYKLPPGTWLSLSEADWQNRRQVEPQVYWSAYETARQQPKVHYKSDDAAIDALASVLSTAIKSQLISDVGLGAFLSGGTDSSLIVALMQQQSTQPVKTFSIGFHEKKYNEAEYAKSIAEHLGTDHTELYVSANDGLALVHSLPAMYDEPFADSSQIPMALVTQMAAQSVTVALSGDAGDELFGGYSRYQRAGSWWERREKTLPFVRSLLAGAAGKLAPGFSGNKKDKLQKLNEVLRAADAVDFYRQFVSYWKDPSSVVLGAREPASAFSLSPVGSFLETMMIIDTVSYLPDDILVKVDRAAMACSLETRVPLLDPRMFEFAWGLEDKYRVRDGQNKWLLKQLLYRMVPRTLLERPKKGFSVPMGEWLRGPLKDWADSLLDPSRLCKQGLLDAGQVQERWQQHQAQQFDWSPHLWGVLMLQAWMDHYDVQG
ncbi:asparagine synthase (glutamine-hydrolyzing) [Advenella sp. RU8]|uniref:asparagine synthase (glutamine-hydrolyzing) n=1 Tax=Advenella sp. RU8 TaxID=3399575 RepID=UPI003AADAB52